VTTSRTARGFLVACVLCFLAGHLAFLASFTEDIDSVNFVLGVRDFDSPGTSRTLRLPAYIALGKLSASVRGTGSNEGAARGLALLGCSPGLSRPGRCGVCSRHSRRGRMWRWRHGVALASPLYWFNASRR